jgi:SPX domain protein involved in polyphosphate accumulation
MVQFGLYLRSFQYAPWGEQYLAYENLKNALYEIKERIAPSSPPSPSSHTKKIPAQALPVDPHTLHDQLIVELDANLQKINLHYEKTKDEILNRLNAIKMDSAAENAELKDFKSDLEQCYSQAVILKDFASLNYTGFAKLLKKHDKMLKGHFPPLRLTYIRENVNTQPVFGVLDDIYRLQVETQYLYADFFHDGHRIDAEIALGAALMEKIGESKKSRLAPRTVLFSNVDLSAAEQNALVNTQVAAEKKAADFSMTWMRARVALMSVGQVCCFFSFAIF